MKNHHSLVALPFQESFADYIKNHTQVITPPFPNWEKSFISGTDSPLFKLSHHIEKKSNGQNESSKKKLPLLFSRVTFKEKAGGPPGHVHGGATAALIDEHMGILVWHLQFLCVTQNLQLFYLKPVPLSNIMVAVSEITKDDSQSKNQTLEVRTTLFDEQKTAFVSALGVFHRLTAEQLDKFMKSKNKA